MKERPILFNGPMVRAINEGRKTQTRRVIKGGFEEDVCAEGFTFTPRRCATVWDNGTWHTWDHNGTGGENSMEPTQGLAEVEALNSAYTQGFLRCPYGVPGDRLYVRETFYCDHMFAGDYEQTQNQYLNIEPTKGDCEAEWRGPDDDSNMYFRADVPSGRFDDAGYWGEPGGRWTPSIHMPRWASRTDLDNTDVRVERICDISARDAFAEGYRCSCLKPSPECHGNIEAFLNGDWALAQEPTSWVWAITFGRVGP